LSQAELGCLPIFLTDAGKADPLFASFPSQFDANMGHHDRVLDLPPDAIELAIGRTQPNEAFRMVGKPIYGTQFHSELDAAREKDRLIRYRPYYRDEMPDEEQFNRIVQSLRETTEVDHLMADFLKLFVVESRPLGNEV
jgi:GMP synthase (glutamine-hydrolysing)